MLGVKNMSFTVLGSRFSVRVHVPVRGRPFGRPLVCTAIAAFVLAGSPAAQPVRLASLAQGGPVRLASLAQGEQPAARSEAVDASFTAGVSDAASLRKSVETRLARAQQLLNELLAVTGPRTVANTLEPFDELGDQIQTASGVAGLMAAVHPDEAMRKAGDELERRSDALDAELALRPDVFRALQGLRLDGLDVESRYYVERTLRNLRRLGVDRPEATRTRLKALRDELSVLMAEYLRNTRERGRRFTVSSSKELDGLPADFIARHKPDASGAITLTTDAVDARPVITYATSGELRKRMYVELYTVASPENVAVLDKILAVRGEMARLLGYPNWATYDMSSRMSGDVKTVSAFIDRVVAAAGPKAAREFDELQALKRRSEPGSFAAGVGSRVLRGAGPQAELRLRLSSRYAHTWRSTVCFGASSTSPPGSSR